jgi:hypothetical protein
MRMRAKDFHLGVSTLVVTLVLSGCGGGDDSPPPPPSPPTNPTDQQRSQAATQTALNNSSCTAIHPFYWEIGNGSMMLTGGTAGGTLPQANTQMLVASASKWLFGAYVVQLRNGSLTANDIASLSMRAGYTNLTYGTCIRLNRMTQDALTVNQCFTSASNNGGTNADFNATQNGKYFYNGGHFQFLANGDLQLGATNNATLKTAIAAQLGLDFTFSFDSPQLAAGVVTSGSDYGFFLRKILSNQLRMRDALGTQAVCTNPLSCPTAVSTPIGASESWHYSLGHWVEDDPVKGDGAFSSPGAFGFYPWIDTSKTYYGVLARYSLPLSAGDSVASDSVDCGRKIRKAWVTAVAQ